jgi:hypothetical protein
MSQKIGPGSKGAAQAYGPGSRATITETHHHYGGPLRQADSDIDPAMAEAHLAELPLDQVPAPSPLPSGSRMPWPVNPTFVGREADLKALAAILKGGETAAIGQVAAATGLGGIGKTQLAAAFVHAYGRHPGLVRDGEYLPLALRGARADRVVAFARRAGADWLLVVAPRLVAPLLPRKSGLRIPPLAWQDTSVLLPEGELPRRWRDVFTSAELEPETCGGASEIALAAALSRFPVAVLRPA